MSNEYTNCTRCNQKLPTEHDGLPLCDQCNYAVRQAKKQKDIANKSNRPEPKQPGIREFALSDIRVA
jgi:predicted amidophosphoribosyltransferase